MFRTNLLVYTHSLFSFSPQWQTSVRAPPLASDQNAKLAPLTHFWCLCFNSFKYSFQTNTDESLCMLHTKSPFTPFKRSCHIKSRIKTSGLCEHWINFSSMLLLDAHRACHTPFIPVRLSGYAALVSQLYSRVVPRPSNSRFLQWPESAHRPQPQQKVQIHVCSPI